MAEKTPSERMEELAEELRKLTKVEDERVVQEERKVKEARKVKTQLEGFDNLGKQLKDSLLAPLKSLASAIPAPLRILGKMAIKPVAVPFLRGRLGTEAPVGGAPVDGPVRHDAFSEAMGREMSQKGYYKGMAASTMAKIPGMGSLAERWGKLDAEDAPKRAKLAGWMGMSTGEPGQDIGLAGMDSEGIIDRLIAIRGTLLGMASDLSVMANAWAPSVEEKLVEIDDNTEPEVVSTALVREQELESNVKRPSVATIKKMGPSGLNWKKLLTGLATVGAAFGLAKAVEFWRDVIIPAGGFSKWWTSSGWPTVKEWAIKIGNNIINAIAGTFGIQEGQFQEWWDATAWPWLKEKGTALGTSIINGIGAVFGVKDGDFKTWWAETGSPMVATFLTTTGLALMTTVITSITDYIKENQEAWLQTIKGWLGNLPQQLIGAVTGITVAGWAGMKIGGLLGATAGGIGAIPGAIVGLLVGMAIGAIVGWLGGDIWADMQKATEKQLNTFWAKKRDAAAWGAIAGVTVSSAMIAALALAPVTGGMSIPAMIAFVLLSAGVGAIWKFITGGFDPTEEKLPEEIQKEMQLKAERAKMGWFGNLWAWIKDSLMWKPFEEGSPFEQSAAREGLKPEFNKLSPGVEMGLWQNIQEKMSSAYDAMDNLLKSIDAQIQSLVDSTLGTITNMWDDLTSWFSNLEEQSIQDNANAVQDFRKSIHDLYALERLAGDFGGTRYGIGGPAAGTFPGPGSLEGDQTNLLPVVRSQNLKPGPEESQRAAPIVINQTSSGPVANVRVEAQGDKDIMVRWHNVGPMSALERARLRP